MTPAQRLRYLRAALPSVPSERVSLHAWRKRTARAIFATDVPDTMLAEDCGTLACAVGWACGMRELQADGLTYENSAPTFTTADGQRLRQWEAVNAFFELTPAESAALFSSVHFDSAADLARHVRTGGWTAEAAALDWAAYERIRGDADAERDALAAGRHREVALARLDRFLA